jgi:hypothetical protein
MQIDATVTDVPDKDGVLVTVKMNANIKILGSPMTRWRRWLSSASSAWKSHRSNKSPSTRSRATCAM